jgi:hypothetical protein
MSRKTQAALVLLVTTLLGAGCTSVQQGFPGETSESVWKAMCAVAETPDYVSDPDPARRWVLTKNEVFVDDEALRIEIFRELDRVLHRPGARPLREQRTWRFRIELEEKENTPVATFFSRGFAIPLKAQDEAARYYDDVWKLLGGRPKLTKDGELIARDPAD